MASYNDVREGLAWYVGYRKQMYTNEQIRGAHEALTKNTMITTTKTTRKTVVKIINYHRYQDPFNYTKPTTKPTTKPKRSPHEGTDDKQTGTINNKHTASDDAASNESTQSQQKGTLISKLYYDCINVLDLPNRNNRTIKGYIQLMEKKKDAEAQVIAYLTFIHDRYATIQFPFKPILSKAEDIYAKRVNIIENAKRAGIDILSLPSDGHAIHTRSPEEIEAQERYDREQEERDAERHRRIHERAALQSQEASAA